jgi:hypothetical protein
VHFQPESLIKGVYQGNGRLKQVSYDTYHDYNTQTNFNSFNDSLMDDGGACGYNKSI